ncbi:MAG: lytic murein transglycosylase [Acidimicrobiales bacterium]
MSGGDQLLAARPVTAQPRARSRRFAAGWLVAAILLAGPATARAQPEPGSPPATAPGDPADPDVPAVAPELAGVPVDDLAVQRANESRRATAAALTQAQQTRAGAEARMAELQTEDARLAAVIDTETARRDAAAEEAEHARRGVRDIAIASYIHGDPSAVVATLLDDPNGGTEARGQHLVLSEVSAARLDEFSEAMDERRAARRAIDDATEARAEGRAELATVTATLEQAAADEERLTGELADRQLHLDRARATATVTGTDLTLVALDAYWRAQQALAADRPDCGLPWWALAGIGRAESHHGNFRGTVLEPDGETSTPIVGIALDGNNGTRHIPDSDDGTLDGDTEFDRAVGPMQFIPSTWRRHSRDANGDGRIDPHNIYDASLTAGHYLCAGGAAMVDEAGLRAGFFRYNHSQSYVDTVLALAYSYRDAALPVPTVPAWPPVPSGG